MKLSAVDEALDRIGQGAVADDLESDRLEFKQDPVTIDSRHRSSNPRAELVDILVETVVCFANGRGGTIVLGVADRRGGMDALVGTDADPDDLRRKIFHKTRPNLAVTVQEHSFRGRRFLVVEVDEGLDLYADSRGRATHRVGDACEPLGEEQRLDLSFRRRNPDYTARRSTRAVEAIEAGAIDEVRRLLRRFADLRAEMAELSVPGLLRSLGVVDDTGNLLVAGEILLCRPAVDVVSYLARESPGADPRSTTLREPLIVALPAVLERVRLRSEPELAHLSLRTGQEIAIPDFPPVAVDEAVTNAFLHRDWSRPGRVVVDHSPQVLRVWSPGGLPPGVDQNRLLTTVSRPRNPTLMSAVGTLGLVEQSSRGIDRMYREMIRTGRDEPTIASEEFSVEVTFTSGAPNHAFARFVAELPERLQGDVNVLLILKYLCAHERLDTGRAATLLQVGRAEATRIIETVGTGSSALLVQDSGSRDAAWHLAPGARSALGSAVSYRARPQESLRQVVAHVDEYGWITNKTIRNLFGLDVQQARALLDRLRGDEILVKDPDGPARGPGIRWLPGQRFPGKRTM